MSHSLEKSLPPYIAVVPVSRPAKLEMCLGTAQSGALRRKKRYVAITGESDQVIFTDAARPEK